MSDSDKRRHTLVELSERSAEQAAELRDVEKQLTGHTERLNEQDKAISKTEASWREAMEKEKELRDDSIALRFDNLDRMILANEKAANATYQKNRNLYDWAIIGVLVVNAIAWVVHVYGQ